MHNPGDTWIGKNISFLLEHHKCDPDLQFRTLEQSPSSLPGIKNLTFDSAWSNFFMSHPVSLILLLCLFLSPVC